MEFNVGEIIDRVKEIDDRVIKEYHFEQKLVKSEMKRILSVGNSLFGLTRGCARHLASAKRSHTKH
jgi:hypothetical protein